MQESVIEQAWVQLGQRFGAQDLAELVVQRWGCKRRPTAYDGQAQIVELLIQSGADVNALEINGRTPLHDAANGGHLDVIDVLVRNGADLEAKDNEGMTPLMWGKISRSGRSEQVVEKFLQHGGNKGIGV